MTEPDLWRCAVCDHLYVIPTLARACEARHAREEAAP